jgi:hypothetical protein
MTNFGLLRLFRGAIRGYRIQDQVKILDLKYTDFTETTERGLFITVFSAKISETPALRAGAVSVASVSQSVFKKQSLRNAADQERLNSLGSTQSLLVNKLKPPSSAALFE